MGDAGVYTVFAGLLAYAIHGWMCVHVDQARQLQSYDRGRPPARQGGRAVPKGYVDKIPPAQEAVRTIAALLTSLVYAVFPFAPATSSWMSFVGWTFALALYWDLHFYVYHMAAHESRTLYVYFHKLHHTNKQPGPFNAYFVTYQSHFVAEHLVVLIAAFCGLPRDVFTWTLWWGTLGTFIEHAGHDMGSLPLPFLGQLGVTWGVISTALSPWTLVLGGESTAEHDWHHEKFTTNYALSFTYLDKLFGTYHPGRKPGEALASAVA
jgi:sterol desaturase/sphingolipid hydroxylase (fatty acid hydroxylase superfamily)